MEGMHDWATAAPAGLKFEGSPTESVLSTPDEMYPSLFGTSAQRFPSSLDTVNPLAMVSPQSLPDLSQPEVPALSALAPPTPGAESPEAEKKQPKKRKSWGQQLPEPKTNLPPRKRAKTEDEKEQRRVERVLRNRRAAQSSRERKRLEVESLEQRNRDLEAALLRAQELNRELAGQLRGLRAGTGVVSRGAPTFEALRQTPLTFSQPLFNSQDGHGAASLRAGASRVEEYFQSLPSSNQGTVNPASLSPSLGPIPEAAEELDELASAAVSPAGAPATAKANASADATQHPAAVLCQDLQCRSVEAAPSAWLTASQRQLPPPALSLLLQIQFLLASTSALLSACQRPLIQIAFSMTAGFSIRPTPAITTTILRLVTTPHRSRSRPTSTSATSSTPSPPSTTSSSSTAPATPLPTPRRPTSRPSSTLRLRTLRRILTCSPTLARPLSDATMAVLRLVSTEGCVADRVGRDGEASAPAAAAVAEAVVARELPDWPSGTPLPTREVLLTLAWVLRVEEAKRVAKERGGVVGVQEKLAAKKRGREEAHASSSSSSLPVKRRRGL